MTPASLSAKYAPADRERFVRQARVAAALNRTNIATVFEIKAGEASSNHPGQMFIAMEGVERKTVREMIDAEPLKIDDGIRIAMQIVEGLHTAYEKSVVHRDIKSANTMVTPKGMRPARTGGILPCRAQILSRGWM